MRIAIPKRLEPKLVSSFLNVLLPRARHERVIEIDFSSLRFAKPFGTIALLVGLREALRLRRELGYVTKIHFDARDSDGCGYLNYFGFFEHIDIEKPSSGFDSINSSSRYMEITRLERASFEFADVPFQEKLDQLSIHLAKLLLKIDRYEHSMVLATAWALREAIRNVFEHAQVDEAFLMAQAWSDGRAEIALGDGGIGILKGLSKVFKLRHGVDALKLAVLPGISEYQGDETNDRWQNSGFGLFMLCEAAKEFGSLYLGSSDALLEATNDGVVVGASGYSTGTVLGLNFSVGEDVYWSNFLERTRVRGEEAALRIKGARTKASASSSLIWALSGKG